MSIKRLFTFVLVVVLLTGVSVAFYVEALRADPVEAGAPRVDADGGYAVRTGPLPDVRRRTGGGHALGVGGGVTFGAPETDAPVGTCCETLVPAEG